MLQCWCFVRGTNYAEYLPFHQQFTSSLQTAFFLSPASVLPLHWKLFSLPEAILTINLFFFFLTGPPKYKITLFLTVLSICPLQLKCLPASGTFLLSQSLSSPRIFHLSDSNHVQPETLFLVGTVALFEIGTESSNSSRLWRNLESNEDVTIEINGDKE